MFGKEFYNSTTRKLITVFGTLFNEIIISRDDNASVQQKRFKVPLSYGPRQKFLAKLQEDATNTRPTAVQLPRMSFQLEGVTYDPDRQLGHIVRNNFSANSSVKTTQFVPTPYNLEFTLSIYAKYSEDGTKIVEQILPFFKPEWTSSVKMIDDIEEYFDIPVILNSVNPEEVYEGSFEERRVVMWNLSFTMKAYFFGPTTTKKIIKFANVNVYTPLTSNTPFERVRVYPAVTSANVAADFLPEQTVLATATSNISGDSVNTITVSNNGLGYSTATITLSGPESGSNTATATANVVADRIQDITVTMAGSGYSTAPTITISAPDNVSVNNNLIEPDDAWDFVVIIEDLDT